jgi:hypothetical protein
MQLHTGGRHFQALLASFEASEPIQGCLDFWQLSEEDRQNPSRLNEDLRGSFLIRRTKNPAVSMQFLPHSLICRRKKHLPIHFFQPDAHSSVHDCSAELLQFCWWLDL